MALKPENLVALLDLLPTQDQALRRRAQRRMVRGQAVDARVFSTLPAERSDRMERGERFVAAMGAVEGLSAPLADMIRGMVEG